MPCAKHSACMYYHCVIEENILEVYKLLDILLGIKPVTSSNFTQSCVLRIVISNFQRGSKDSERETDSTTGHQAHPWWNRH